MLETQQEVGHLEFAVKLYDISNSSGVRSRDLKFGQYMQCSFLMKSYQNALQKSKGVTMAAIKNIDPSP